VTFPAFLPAGAGGVRIAVAGATGAVGREMMALLERRDVLPVAEVVPLASARSAGTRLRFRDRDCEVASLDTFDFAGVDYALFSAGGDRSRQHAPRAAAAGAVVIDNSSAFRMDDGVPLVVPEVNAGALAVHRGIVANPNCSTIQMVLVLQALHRAAGLRRVVVSTYQSTSGAGQQGMDELQDQLRATLGGEALVPRVFRHPIALDCLPAIGEVTAATGYTQEEEKMVYETRKILGLPALAVSATCVRVPVMRGHQESLTVDLERPLRAAEARAVLASMPGLRVEDEPAAHRYPTARQCEGDLDTWVGRIREDIALAGTLHCWVASDNLLKGAAWNAVQIAETLHFPRKGS
jgi:aspartate-semialdehyde dehydrogenase